MTPSSNTGPTISFGNGPMINEPSEAFEAEVGEQDVNRGGTAADFHRLKAFLLRQFNRTGHAAAGKVDHDDEIVLRIPPQEADHFPRGRVLQPDNVIVVKRGIFFAKLNQVPVDAAQSRWSARIPKHRPLVKHR